MRVLRLYSGNLFGGVENYLVLLAKLRYLAPDLETAFGLCFHGPLYDRLVDAGVRVYDLGEVRLRYPWTVWRARQRLRALLQDPGFDVVVTHSCWPHVIFGPVVRQAGVRLVHWVHDLLTGRQWIERWAGRTPPDLVMANSRFTAGPARQLFARSPVEVCYHPVSPPGAQDTEGMRHAVRAELGTPPSRVVILQASRLERWKGHRVHLEALARLRGMPDWEAWFAGGPQKAGEAAYLAELRELTARAGIADRVRFLGQRADVPRLMAGADIFCQPNVGPEPFGLVFVEALYAGLPVVGSSTGGTLEIVDDACGVLLPAGDVPAVADALAGLVRDPDRRRALGSVGPAKAAALCFPPVEYARLCKFLAGSNGL